jgi:5-methylcytosine-specific restriction endonuclease McrA
VTVKTHALKKIGENLKMQRGPCWLCNQPIDYNLSAKDPMSFSIDHIKPQSTHPELAEEPSNCRAAHRLCNVSRGNRDPKPAIGITSRNW